MLNQCLIKIYPNFLIRNDVHMGLRVVIFPLPIFSEITCKVQEVKQRLLSIHMLSRD